MSKDLATSRFWVGIDVAKHSFHAAVADETCVPRAWAALPAAPFAMSSKGMDAFLAWLRGLGVAKSQVSGVCIEATGRCSQTWIKCLNKRLDGVSVLNPAQSKAFASSLGIRDKSDHVDACVLAIFGKVHAPEPSRADSRLQRELREIVRLRHALEVQFQANAQRLADGPTCAVVRASLKKANQALARQITRLGDAADKLIRKDETLAKDLKRAGTVKGIGPKTATLLLAEFGDLREYNRDELVALAGLYPREYSSGSSVHKKPRLAKAGKASVRAALYMCAMSAIRANPAIAAFASRLAQNGKQPMQILGAVMRKLLLLVHAVIVTGKDYDPAFGQQVKSPTA